MTPRLTKVIAPSLALALVIGLAGAAFAQPAAGGSLGSAAPAAAPPATDTAEGSAAPPAGSAAPSATDPAPGAMPAPPPDEARKLCAAAMNKDPAFAAEIIKVADEQAAQKRDADTVAAHVDAYQHVQKNERHVIYAYAAMWIVAAGFVVFLWRRQQALRAEIENLRRDLDAAADEVKPTERRS